MAHVGRSLLCPHARHQYRQCQPEQRVGKLVNLLWVNTFRGPGGNQTGMLQASWPIIDYCVQSRQVTGGLSQPLEPCVPFGRPARAVRQDVPLVIGHLGRTVRAGQARAHALLARPRSSPCGPSEHAPQDGELGLPVEACETRPACPLVNGPRQPPQRLRPPRL